MIFRPIFQLIFQLIFRLIFRLIPTVRPTRSRRLSNLILFKLQFECQIISREVMQFVQIQTIRSLILNVLPAKLQDRYKIALELDVIKQIAIYSQPFSLKFQRNSMNIVGRNAFIAMHFSAIHSSQSTFSQSLTVITGDKGALRPGKRATIVGLRTVLMRNSTLKTQQKLLRTSCLLTC